MLYSPRGEGAKLKRAQGIGINVVIIAAIALLVLVLVSLIAGGKLWSFKTESETNCSAKGGMCLSADAAFDPSLVHFPAGDKSCNTATTGKQCYVPQ